MKRFHRMASAVLGVLLGVLLLVQPVVAESEKSTFKARRSLGVLFLAGSLALTKQGFDFRDDADEFYVRYKKAGTPAEADRLYTRTNNRDVKSQVSWALAAALAVSGTRLFLAKADDAHPASRLNAARRLASGFSLEPQLEPRRFGLELKRRFF